MFIRSSKTERHDNGGVIICLIFPELRPYLEAALDEAPDGAVFVVHQYNGRQANLRMRFTGIIKQAGLKPWPKLFQNLRATRETEMIQKFPAPDAASWIGNSVPVAMEHYVMATEENFERAKSEQTSEMRAFSRAPSSTPDESEEPPQDAEALQITESASPEGQGQVSSRNQSKWAVQNSNL